MTVFIVLAVGLLLTATLIGIAPVIGWFDRREGLEYRKPIEENIPVVGGAAILGAVAAGALVDPTLHLPWPALITAFLLGLADDVRRGGLSPTVKLSGQILVATLLIVLPGPGLADHTSTELLLTAVFALVAMNAVNLFDHADGMAGTACCVALIPAAPPLGAAVGAYLPFNVLFRQRKTFRESMPSTMLGDAGTHLLGVMIAITPGAIWLLLIPVLDAGRVVVSRILRGEPFWRGDRTHLGNRLASVGFGPLSVSLVVAVLMAPPIIAQIVTGEEGISTGAMVISVFLYIIAVDATKGHVAPALETREEDLDPLRPAVPSPEDEGPRTPRLQALPAWGPDEEGDDEGEHQLPAAELKPRQPLLVARVREREVPRPVRHSDPAAAATDAPPAARAEGSAADGAAGSASDAAAEEPTEGTSSAAPAAARKPEVLRPVRGDSGAAPFAEEASQDPAFEAQPESAPEGVEAERPEDAARPKRQGPHSHPLTGPTPGGGPSLRGPSEGAPARRLADVDG